LPARLQGKALGATAASTELRLGGLIRIRKLPSIHFYKKQ
jgi:hypothetical protein